MRADDHSFRRGQGLAEQATVLALAFFAFAEPGFAEIDLILQFEPAIDKRPNGPSHGRQGRHDAVEQGVIEFERRKIRLRQLRDFAHQAADLLFRLFDEFRIDRLFGAHAFMNRGGFSR